MLAHLKKRFPKEPEEMSIRIAFATISISGRENQKGKENFES